MLRTRSPKPSRRGARNLSLLRGCWGSRLLYRSAYLQPGKSPGGCVKLRFTHSPTDFALFTFQAATAYKTARHCRAAGIAHGRFACRSQLFTFNCTASVLFKRVVLSFTCGLFARVTQSTRHRWRLSTLSMEMRGFEPLASCLQSRRSPTELHPRVKRSFTFAVNAAHFCGDATGLHRFRCGSAPTRTADLSLIRRVL